MQVIYLVPHTHYDVAWAFSRQDYLAINEKILEQALEIMDASAEFKFCIEQTFLLEAIEKGNPRLWSRLKERIKEGRLRIIDGQYLMPDTMLPAGEVLIREILFGKSYCREKFGIEVPVAWAADSFGMNAQLPQIYQKSGYKWLAFRRGARHDIMQSESLWEGLDGTTILAHWMPLGYRAGLELDRLEESYTELRKYASTPNILMPSGSGSMPPQPEVVGAVSDWNAAHPDIRMVIATPEEFFEALERAGKSFEVAKGELYDDELVNVFPQVCASRTWIVQNMRECEGLLVTCEEFATIAWLLGARYPAQELHRAWKQILFIAFHDIITGCGVDEIYREAEEIFASLKKETSQVLSAALSYIARKVNTRGEGVMVFNPMPWEVRDRVETEREKTKVGFMVDAPPLGYKVYNALPEDIDSEDRIVETDEAELENSFFKVKVDRNSGIIEVFDRGTGKLLVRGNELVIEDESGDLYYHRCRFADLIKSESGDGLQYGSFKPRSFRVEKGKLTSKVIFEDEYYCLTWPYRLKERFPPLLYRHKTLDIRKEVIIFRDIPRIEFVTRIDNSYPNIRLRVKFDTGIKRKVYFRETQFGVISEPTEYFSRTAGAKPSAIPNFMSWFDLDNGTRGITFMNRGLPALEIKDGSVYITLFRSVYGLSADGVAGPLVPTPDALELRKFTFEYAIEPHEGDWRQARMYRRAQDYLHRLLPLQANYSGDLPGELSFLELKPDNLILSALKKAEGEDRVILRFFETRGEATGAELRVFKPIKGAWTVNLLEQEAQSLEVDGQTLKLRVKPFEIVTLKLEF